MHAAIIAIGSELLGTTRLDTNSLRLSECLEKYGVGLSRKSVVRDSVEEIARELSFSLSRQEVVILTGGLGPTEDDLTREAVAKALRLTLEEDPSILRVIEKRFEARSLRMPAVNARQAQVFSGQKTLLNDRGTAPGFHLNVMFEGAPRDIWIFPGVPYELDGMIDKHLEPWLQAVRKGKSRFRRVLRITGMTESAVEEKLLPFYRENPHEPVTILSSQGEIQIHLQADGTPEEGLARLDSWERRLREIFGERIFGLDDESLELIVGRLLARRAETVSTAESCTGGLLASRITDVAGSSAYFLGGAVAYSRGPKLFMVGVDPAKIDEHGEVSEEVAREMAAGVRRRFGTTYGVGITGIAGPGGGSEDKPVGTVHLAVANQQQVKHRKALFGGSREVIKRYSTQAALDMLRLFIVRQQ